MNGDGRHGLAAGHGDVGLLKNGALEGGLLRPGANDKTDDRDTRKACFHGVSFRVLSAWEPG